MKKASWIILSVVGALTLLGSLSSVGIAYASFVEDKIGPATLTELSARSPDLATAVKARRATAGAYGAGFATLFLAIAPRPLPPRRCVGMASTIGWHAGRISADPAQSPVPRHQSGGARGGHWGGHSTFESRSIGSGRTRFGSRF